MIYNLRPQVQGSDDDDDDGLPLNHYFIFKISIMYYFENIKNFILLWLIGIEHKMIKNIIRQFKI